MIDLTWLQETASRLVPHASLGEVRLFGVSAFHRGFARDDGEVALSDLSIRLESGPDDEESRGAIAYVLVVQVQVVDSAVDTGGEQRVLAEIEVGYGALYLFSDEAGSIGTEERRAFGYTVAAMTVWPYIRAVISSVLADMGYGTNILIPTMTQREIAEAAAAAPSDPGGTADVTGPEGC